MVSVVVGDDSPPRRRRWPSSPGKLQQRCCLLSCVRLREGRGENSVPVYLSQDRDDDVQPPQMRLPQLVWPSLFCSRSWPGQVFPLAGLYSSTFLMELSVGYPPVMRNPGTIDNCHIHSENHKLTPLLPNLIDHSIN